LRAAPGEDENTYFQVNFPPFRKEVEGGFEINDQLIKSLSISLYLKGEVFEK